MQGVWIRFGGGMEALIAELPPWAFGECSVAKALIENFQPGHVVGAARLVIMQSVDEQSFQKLVRLMQIRRRIHEPLLVVHVKLLIEDPGLTKRSASRRS